MKIVDYSESQADQIGAFNSRLLDGGSDAEFVPYAPPSGPSPPPVERRSYTALEEDGTVRGGYSVIRQQFLIHERRETAAFLQFPLSEGIVDPRFGLIGTLLVRDFVDRNPFCFGLGMGGVHHPLPQLLSKMGFQVAPVPFLFYVNHPSAFVRNLVYLNRSPILRTFAHAVAATRLAWPPVRAVHLFLERARASTREVHIEEMNAFGSWTDTVWQKCRGNHSMVAIRDRRVMQDLYREDDQRLHRLVFHDSSGPIGWALLGDTQLQDHNYFGNMRLGSVIDCLAVRGRYPEVARGATDYLRRRGVDLIVCNQQDAQWVSALRRTGYLMGRSNFILATSPELTRRVKESDQSLARVHLNRGDGDGPYNI